MTQLLDSLKLPDDIRSLSNSDLRRLAGEVRVRIIETVSRNGGHLAPNLGVVELTIAMLSCMDFPTDKVVWDVGHQCYTYKLLTDRADRFHTLRQLGGISGFPLRDESPYDASGAGHASTSISAALGMAMARDLRKERHRVVAVIGDGALTGGIAWEALNNAGDAGTDLFIILNDNKMSIAPNVGALAEHIGQLRTLPFYRNFEDGIRRLFGKLPVGGKLLAKTTQAVKDGITNWVSPKSGIIFESMGLSYVGPIDGHDVVLMGLFSSGDLSSTAVLAGIEYLVQSQRDDGNWDEPYFTATGFPRVFYLSYHLYRLSFPLLAMGSYINLTAGK